MNETRPCADLVPQQGAMVLLEEILRFGETDLIARTGTHRNRDHPLAFEGRLPAWAGIEYAAQAMAAHFSLVSTLTGPQTIGLLGGLRDVVLSVATLDDIEGDLLVVVERLSRDAAGSIYAWKLIDGPAGRELLRGRATVVQQLRGDG